MAVFEYRALQPNGTIAEGRLDAGGRQEAVRIMEERGLTPVKLSETDGAPEKKSAAGFKLPAKGQLFGVSKRVPFAALEDFTRSLSSLLAANVPLSRALTILYKETSNPAAAAKWREIYDLVVDGVPLAVAMSRSPEVFPRVYVAMVEAGEAGGFLDVVLAQIADFQAREKELRAKVTSAMMYPAVLLFLAVAVLIFLMVFFIPRFQTLFEGFDAALPALTQVIVGISNVIRHYGLYLVAAIGAAIYFSRAWFRRESSRRLWESWLLRTPVVGPLMAQIAMARFCRMLGTLLGAGVTLMSGLSVARRSLGYQVLIDLVTESTERVQKGEALAVSLGNARALFAGSTLEMISVAEESGRLDTELMRLANTTEVTLDRQLKTAVALAEPIMLFLIAGLIGTIFIGMVIPIFTIQDYIK
ncbi:MAG: type pilus assembly protein PilC [Chthoniobacter sp.]|jgi:type II secretory pathway component PulF|nr:type pilus assembly protein PilC [Chthoniobacter sp.]